MDMSAEKLAATVNLSMFYLSPYYPTQFPLLGAVQKFCYPLFVLTYVAIFTGLSGLVWKIANLARRKRNHG